MSTGSIFLLLQCSQPFVTQNFQSSWVWEKSEDFPKENSNIKEQAALFHVLERYQKKGVPALCEEQAGGDACQTERAGGSVKKERVK